MGEGFGGRVRRTGSEEDLAEDVLACWLLDCLFACDFKGSQRKGRIRQARVELPSSLDSSSSFGTTIRNWFGGRVWRKVSAEGFGGRVRRKVWRKRSLRIGAGKGVLATTQLNLI